MAQLSLCERVGFQQGLVTAQRVSARVWDCRVFFYDRAKSLRERVGLQLAFAKSLRKAGSAAMFREGAWDYTKVWR